MLHSVPFRSQFCRQRSFSIVSVPKLCLCEVNTSLPRLNTLSTSADIDGTVNISNAILDRRGKRSTRAAYHFTGVLQGSSSSSKYLSNSITYVIGIWRLGV